MKIFDLLVPTQEEIDDAKREMVASGTIFFRNSKFEKRWLFQLKDFVIYRTSNIVKFDTGELTLFHDDQLDKYFYTFCRLDNIEDVEYYLTALKIENAPKREDAEKYQDRIEKIEESRRIERSTLKYKLSNLIKIPGIGDFDYEDIDNVFLRVLVFIILEPTKIFLYAFWVLGVPAAIIGFGSIYWDHNPGIPGFLLTVFVPFGWILWFVPTTMQNILTAHIVYKMFDKN